MSWTQNMSLLRSLIFNYDNQAINILAPTELEIIYFLISRLTLL